MSKKELLLDQLAVCRNEESWIKPLSIALKGLSVADVLWRQNEGSHTIGEIVNHLRFYNERWLRRYKGEPLIENVVNNASTFKVDELSEKGWKNLVNQLDLGLDSWQQVIEQSSESKFNEQIPGYPEDAKWWADIKPLHS